MSSLPDFWLTTKEVASLLRVSERHVRRLLGAFEVRWEEGRRSRGGRVALISVLSLPPYAQKRWREAQQVNARDRYGRTLAEIEERHGPEALRQALQRDSAVKMAREFLETGGGRHELEMVARAHGITVRTLYRWLREDEEVGFMGLVKPRGKPERSPAASASFDPEAVEFVKRLWEQPIKPTVAHVYRELVKKAAEEGWRIGSRATCYRLIAEIPYTEKVFFREGEKAWERKCMPKRRIAPPEYANSVWVADHHKFDLFISYGKRVVRPWLTAIMDMHSRAIVGWAISIKPSGDTIAVAFRHGVLPKQDPDDPTQGLPVRFYSDNGKDYRSERLEVALAQLKVEHILAHPEAPWARGAKERFYRTVADQFSRFQPGWVGANTKERPEGAHAAVKRLHQQGKLHTLQTLTEAFAAWLKTGYHMVVHQGMTCTPWEEFANGPLARVETVDRGVLAMCLMKVKWCRVYSTGIRMYYRDYVADELIPLVGETVAVRYDPAEMGRLYVFHKGKFLCEAREAELLKMGASEEDLQRWMREQARERKRLREQLQARKTFEKEVEERKAAGPTKATTGSRQAEGKVRQLTGLEKAAAALESPAPTPASGGQARGRVPEDPAEMADRWLLEYGRKLAAQKGVAR